MENIDVRNRKIGLEVGEKNSRYTEHRNLNSMIGKIPSPKSYNSIFHSTNFPYPNFYKFWICEGVFP